MACLIRFFLAFEGRAMSMIFSFERLDGNDRENDRAPMEQMPILLGLYGVSDYKPISYRWKIFARSIRRLSVSGIPKSQSRRFSSERSPARARCRWLRVECCGSNERR